MATYTTELFTASDDGKNIKVAATGTPGTLIHTSSSGLDEIYLWAVNSDSVDRLLTVEFGGTVGPDDVVTQLIPAQAGLYIIIPGLMLTNGNVVRAYADAANVVMVNGYVNRIG